MEFFYDPTDRFDLLPRASMLPNADGPPSISSVASFRSITQIHADVDAHLDRCAEILACVPADLGVRRDGSPAWRRRQRRQDLEHALDAADRALAIAQRASKDARHEELAAEHLLPVRPQLYRAHCLRRLGRAEDALAAYGVVVERAPGAPGDMVCRGPDEEKLLREEAMAMVYLGGLNRSEFEEVEEIEDEKGPKDGKEGEEEKGSNDEKEREDEEDAYETDEEDVQTVRGSVKAEGGVNQEGEDVAADEKDAEWQEIISIIAAGPSNPVSVILVSAKEPRPRSASASIEHDSSSERPSSSDEASSEADTVLRSTAPTSLHRSSGTNTPSLDRSAFTISDVQRRRQETLRKLTGELAQFGGGSRVTSPAVVGKEDSRRLRRRWQDVWEKLVRLARRIKQLSANPQSDGRRQAAGRLISEFLATHSSHLEEQGVRGRVVPDQRRDMAVPPSPTPSPNTSCETLDDLDDLDDLTDDQVAVFLGVLDAHLVRSRPPSLAQEAREWRVATMHQVRGDPLTGPLFDLEVRPRPALRRV